MARAPPHRRSEPTERRPQAMLEAANRDFRIKERDKLAFLRTYEAWLIGKEVFKEADARKKRAQLENHYRVRFDADLARLSLDELRRFRQARTEYGEWLTNEDQNPSRAADR